MIRSNLINQILQVYQTEAMCNFSSTRMRAERAIKGGNSVGVTVSTPFYFGIYGLCMSYDIDILEECNDHCVNYGFEIICFLRRFLGIQDTF